MVGPHSSVHTFPVAAQLSAKCKGSWRVGAWLPDISWDCFDLKVSDQSFNILLKVPAGFIESYALR